MRIAGDQRRRGSGGTQTGGGMRPYLAGILVLGVAAATGCNQLRLEIRDSVTGEELGDCVLHQRVVTRKMVAPFWANMPSAVPGQEVEERHDVVRSGETVRLLDFEGREVHLLVVWIAQNTQSTFILTKPGYDLVEISPGEVRRSCKSEGPLVVHMRHQGTTVPTSQDTH